MWSILRLLVSVSALLLISEARRSKRTDVEFSTDADVQRYLTDRNKDMVLFRCKKIVMVQWLHSVVPYVDLECEVLGEVQSVNWYFNDTLIDTANLERMKGTVGMTEETFVGGNKRFISLSQPHYHRRTFFNSWRDYKLRMLHVRESDNGPYTIKVSGPSGYTETRDLMLEVMTEYRDEKWTKWMQNVEADRSKAKSAKRSEKLRRRELMRQLRKRAKDRKNQRNQSLIHDD